MNVKVLLQTQVLVDLEHLVAEGAAVYFPFVLVLVGTVMGQYGVVIGAGHFVALIAYLFALLLSLVFGH